MFCFDVKKKVAEGDFKITQESLFNFINFFKTQSMLAGGKSKLEDGEILKLDQVETDIFFEIFKVDFAIISRALIDKINKK